MTIQRKSIVLVLLLMSILVLSCAPKGQKPVEQVSGGAIACDSAACPSGVDCGGAPRICTETVNTCIDEEILEVCIAGGSAVHEACPYGMRCEDGDCYALGEDEEGYENACGVTSPCQDDSDCDNSDQWDGEYCSDSNCCYFKITNKQVQLTEKNLTVEMTNYSRYPEVPCDCQIQWGDEPEGMDQPPQVTDCSKVENRTHVYSKAGSYHIRMTDTEMRCGAALK